MKYLSCDTRFYQKHVYKKHEAEIRQTLKTLKKDRFRPTFRSLSDILCSDVCRTKKAFQYVERMLPLFRAVVKLCTTSRVFLFLICF